MRTIPSRFPEVTLASDLIRRGALVWGALRLLLALVSLLMEAPAVHLAASAAVAVIMTTGVVRFVGGRWRNEPYILANLGVSQTTATLLSLAPAVLGESVIALVVPR